MISPDISILNNGFVWFCGTHGYFTFSKTDLDFFCVPALFLYSHFLSSLLCALSLFIIIMLNLILHWIYCSYNNIQYTVNFICDLTDLHRHKFCYLNLTFCLWCCLQPSVLVGCPSRRS